MAITTQIFKAYDDTPAERVVLVDGVAYDNYPGGEITSRPSRWAGEGVQVFSTHHVGLVITTRERNYYDDSDFYALVWNPETQSVEGYDYATTRMGGTDDNHASADLLDEYKPAYAAHLVERQMAYLRGEDHRAWREAAWAAFVPSTKGQQVVVRRGRKVPVGTTGIIGWVGEDNYGGTRIGIRTADGEMVFTAASNVDVIVDADDLPYEADFTRTDEEYRRLAEHTAGIRTLLGPDRPDLVVVA